MLTPWRTAHRRTRIKVGRKTIRHIRCVQLTSAKVTDVNNLRRVGVDLHKLIAIGNTDNRVKGNTNVIQSLRCRALPLADYVVSRGFVC